MKKMNNYQYAVILSALSICSGSNAGCSSNDVVPNATGTMTVEQARVVIGEDMLNKTEEILKKISATQEELKKLKEPLIEKNKQLNENFQRSLTPEEKEVYSIYYDIKKLEAEDFNINYKAVEPVIKKDSKLKDIVNDKNFQDFIDIWIYQQLFKKVAKPEKKKEVEDKIKKLEEKINLKDSTVIQHLDSLIRQFFDKSQITKELDDKIKSYRQQITKSNKDFYEHKDVKEIQKLLSEEKKKAITQNHNADSLITIFGLNDKKEDTINYFYKLLIANKDLKVADIEQVNKFLKKELERNKESEEFKKLSLDFSVALEVLPTMSVFLGTYNFVKEEEENQRNLMEMFMRAQGNRQ